MELGFTVRSAWTVTARREARRRVAGAEGIFFWNIYVSRLRRKLISKIQPFS